jgi:hypothetical protein
MEKFKKFLKKAGNVIWTLLNSRVFYIVLIGLLVVFGLRQCGGKRDLKIDNAILTQNVIAARDSITIIITENGDLQGEKAIFIKSEKELKAENSDLYKRIKEQDGNVISLNRTIIRLKQNEKMLNDSIKTLNKIIGEPVQVDKNTWMLPWELDYNWDATNYDHFKGKTFVSVDMNPDGTYKLKPDGTLIVKHDNTLLYDRDSQIDIEFGEKVVGNEYQVYIKSAYPGFSPESMEGVFIDPNTNKDIQNLMKKKHWFTGFSFSISVTAGYDPIGQKPALVVGPSLNYNIYSW